MLSILIPTYNYNVYPLVFQIEKQALKLNFKFEIICIDDGSNSSLNFENEKINSLTYCRFVSAKANVGLSSNRNALAQASKYDFLLFIDGDSLLLNDTFLSNYLNNIHKDIDIIYGGRVHPEHVDSSKKKLRWKYGKCVEDKTALHRSEQIYKTLMFNNTLISKACFNKILFDSILKKYGHEDTLFAYQVAQLNLKVKHIENPVLHGDIDNTDIFIKKTEDGINNLIYIYNSRKIDIKFIKILKYYFLIKKYNLNTPLAFLFKTIKPLLLENLNSSNPSLFLFNVYKLGYLSSIKNYPID